MKPQGKKKTRHHVAGHQDCGICHPPLKPTHNRTARQEAAREIRKEREAETRAEIAREVEAMP